MGYTYKNMIGLTPELAKLAQVSFNLPIYELLVDDNTESLVEDDIIIAHYNDSRIFGIDKLDILPSVKNEFYAKLMEFVINEGNTTNELPYEQSIKDSLYLYPVVKGYPADSASIEELLEFSDIVNVNREMPAQETLEEWEKYHNHFNK